MPSVFDLKASDFLSIYKSDSLIQTLAEGIRASRPNVLRVKGIHGSLDALIFASVCKVTRATQVIILQDKEEAAYFFNDLQNLLGTSGLHFFPMSYKRPYEYDETENANILMRAEVLNQLGNAPDGKIIVTYPEALSEKVITRKSLASNTFIVKSGEILDREFLEEFLNTYHFEKTDFVYEAGQFAVRGGIIDVYSFAHDLPYRIELFGDEVESIRSFDPGSQLSVDHVDHVSLMPDVQTRLVQEDRQSLLEFIPATSRLWIKDFALIGDILQKCFDRATQSFDKIIRNSGGAAVSVSPGHLFETPETFTGQATGFQRIEFGQRFHFPADFTYDFRSSAQPSFNKNFELLVADLLDH